MDYQAEKFATISLIKPKHEQPDSNKSIIRKPSSGGGSTGLPASLITTLNAGLNAGGGE